MVFRNGSFMDGYSWVLPEQDLAYDMKTGESQPLSIRPDGLARAKKKLSVSDAILERNLIPELNASFQ